MSRTLLAGIALIAGLVPAGIAAQTPGAAPPATNVSPVDAAPFIGEWTLNLQGPNGPGVFGLVVKVEKEKVVADISVETMPTQSISDVTKPEKSLVLRYSFDYQGSPVPAVVSLTPTDEGKVNAQIDFAGGAYLMTGTATKKEKESKQHAHANGHLVREVAARGARILVAIRL